MGFLEDVQGTIQQMAERAGPAVVGIGQRWGMGSGIVIAQDQVLTNAHNVREEEVTVTFADGRAATGRVAGTDVDGDIAVISVETGSATPFEWTSDGVSIGMPVIALANPGGRGLRVTFGVISGLERSFRGPRDRRISGSIEHTAPLLPGSSGGPVLDAAGRLLGINTNRLGEGFYLAIPTDTALGERVEALARGEDVVRPRLGVGIAPPWVARRLRRAVGLPEAEGLLVRMVEEGSAAAEAGLERGDLIVEAKGTSVPDPDALYDVLETLKPGDSLELKVLRGVDERTISVALKPQP